MGARGDAWGAAWRGWCGSEQGRLGRGVQGGGWEKEGGRSTGFCHRGEARLEHREGLVDVRGEGSEELLVVEALRGVLRGGLWAGRSVVQALRHAGMWSEES